MCTRSKNVQTHWNAFALHIESIFEFGKCKDKNFYAPMREKKRRTNICKRKCYLVSTFLPSKCTWCVYVLRPSEIAGRKEAVKRFLVSMSVRLCINVVYHLSNFSPKPTNEFEKRETIRNRRETFTMHVFEHLSTHNNTFARVCHFIFITISMHFIRIYSGTAVYFHPHLLAPRLRLDDVIRWQQYILCEAKLEKSAQTPHRNTPTYIHDRNRSETLGNALVFFQPRCICVSTPLKTHRFLFTTLTDNFIIWTSVWRFLVSVARSDCALTFAIHC